MSGPTPGPWSFDGLELVKGANGKIVADVRPCNHFGEELDHDFFDHGEANADLIATSPDLLNIVCRMLGAAEVDGLDRESNVWRSIMIDAREALDKVDGRD